MSDCAEVKTFPASPAAPKACEVAHCCLAASARSSVKPCPSLSSAAETHQTGQQDTECCTLIGPSVHSLCSQTWPDFSYKSSLFIISLSILVDHTCIFRSGLGPPCLYMSRLHSLVFTSCKCPDFPRTSKFSLLSIHALPDFPLKVLTFHFYTHCKTYACPHFLNMSSLSTHPDFLTSKHDLTFHVSLSCRARPDSPYLFLLYVRALTPVYILTFRTYPDFSHFLLLFVHPINQTITSCSCSSALGEVLGDFWRL